MTPAVGMYTIVPMVWMYTIPMVWIGTCTGNCFIHGMPERLLSAHDVNIINEYGQFNSDVVPPAACVVSMCVRECYFVRGGCGPSFFAGITTEGYTPPVVAVVTLTVQPGASVLMTSSGQGDRLKNNKKSELRWW